MWSDLGIMFLQIGLPAVLCLLFGMALLIVEIFLPGFSAPGITGLILVGVGIVLAAKSFAQALLLLLIVMVVIGIALFIAVRSAKSGRLYRSPLVLKESLATSTGYVSSEDLSALQGKRGKTVTLLRPAGVVEIDGRRYDVVSDAEYIDPGTAVEVMAVQGRRIVVRPCV